MSKHLHIITHDVPYPANFGGVVDLFYKLVWLHKLDVKIHLHCYTKNRAEQPELNKYCETVQYYKRNMLSGISFKIPFIVKSRNSKALLVNLQKDNYPILLEGIHCSYLLHKNLFPNRQIALRLHNVEYAYYEKLGNHETNFLKKIYYNIETKLLYKYEKAIANKVIIFTVSEYDTTVYQQQFAVKNIQFLPVFLPYNSAISNTGMGKFCLYHGNLAINENEVAAIWLIENVFKSINIPFVIAGLQPSKKILQLVKLYKNISVIANPTEINMQLLIANAQINILPSFNQTGVKLKLLNALFNGRHCLANLAGVKGSGVEEICTIAETANDYLTQIYNLFTQPFALKQMQHRSAALKKLYNNAVNAQTFKEWLH